MLLVIQVEAGEGEEEGGGGDGRTPDKSILSPFLCPLMQGNKEGEKFSFPPSLLNSRTVEKRRGRKRATVSSYSRGEEARSTKLATSPLPPTHPEGIEQHCRHERGAAGWRAEGLKVS